MESRGPNCWVELASSPQAWLACEDGVEPSGSESRPGWSDQDGVKPEMYEPMSEEMNVCSQRTLVAKVS